MVQLPELPTNLFRSVVSQGPGTVTLSLPLNHSVVVDPLLIAV